MEVFLSSNGKNDIDFDFCDFKTVMSYKGVTLMGIGECEGKNSVEKAIKLSIEHALLEKIPLNKAHGILIHFQVHTNFFILEIADAMEIIYEGASDAADIIWGTTTDSSLREDYVKATVILTGIDNIYAVSNNHSYTIE